MSGRGETFKSGGRVVKNVTGYDLCKLMAGSWGTLAAMTDVTVKTLPRAETEATVLVLGLDDADAAKAMAAAMGSSCDVSGAAHLPADLAVRACESLPARPRGDGAAARRRGALGRAPPRALAELLRAFGATAGLEPTQSRALWRAIRDVMPFAADGPAGARVRLAHLDRAAARRRGRLARSRGRPTPKCSTTGPAAWSGPRWRPADDAGAAIVRGAVAACGGHATLVRAPAAMRAAVAGVRAAERRPLAALTKRVKESFDPNGVLNPGRMWAGV